MPNDCKNLPNLLPQKENIVVNQQIVGTRDYYKWRDGCFILADPAGIGNVTTSTDGADGNRGDWYNLNGQWLGGKPATHGIYIHGHRKVSIK